MLLTLILFERSKFSEGCNMLYLTINPTIQSHNCSLYYPEICVDIIYQSNLYEADYES